MANVCETTDGFMVCGRIVEMEPGSGKAANRLTRIRVGYQKFDGFTSNILYEDVECWDAGSKKLNTFIKMCSIGDFVLVHYEIYNGRNIAISARRQGTVSFTEVTSRGKFPMFCVIGEVAKIVEGDGVYQIYIPINFRDGPKWYRVSFFDTDKFKGASRAKKLVRKGYRICIKGTRPQKHEFEGKTFYDSAGERVFLRPSQEKLKSGIV